MKSRESCEAALRLCDSGDELGVVKLNEVSPNIVLERTEMLFHLQEIWGSSIGPEAGNPGRSFVWFRVYFLAHSRKVHQAGKRLVPSTFRTIYYSLIIPSFDAIHSHFLTLSLKLP
jgi:hypothetical protein